MPILTVEIVTRPGEHFAATLAQELAERAAEVFGSAPGGTWVKVNFIASEHYAENGAEPERAYPVFVSVLKAHRPPPEVLQTEIAHLTLSIAQICNRPADTVHVIYSPEAAGRVAFGGKLLPG